MNKRCKCRICKCELEYNYNYCRNCRDNEQEKIKIYEEKLKKRRKYYAGDKITSIEELDKQDFVYWHGVIRHIEFIKSLQYRTVIKLVNNGQLSRAIKKIIA